MDNKQKNKRPLRIKVISMGNAEVGKVIAYFKNGLNIGTDIPVTGFVFVGVGPRYTLKPIS